MGISASGVPQGSVLSPILFILYINDLLTTVSAPLIYLLMTQRFTAVCMSPSNGFIELQRDFEVTLWSEKWHLPFNIRKCKSLHVGSQNPCHIYVMGGAKMGQTNLEKDWGIHIDSELKFHKQAAAAVAKGNQLLVCINIVTLPLLYKTLVRASCHLEYGNLMWGTFHCADQKLIEGVQ